MSFADDLRNLPQRPQIGDDVLVKACLDAIHDACLCASQAGKNSVSGCCVYDGEYGTHVNFVQGAEHCFAWHDAYHWIEVASYPRLRDALERGIRDWGFSDHEVRHYQKPQQMENLRRIVKRLRPTGQQEDYLYVSIRW